METLRPGAARRAHRLVAGLAWSYAAATLALAVPLVLPGPWPSPRPPWMARVAGLAARCLADGTLALALGPAMLCLAALLATLAMTRVRLRAATATARPARRGWPLRRLARGPGWAPGRAARRGQGLLVPLLALACGLALWRLLPGSGMPVTAGSVGGMVPGPAGALAVSAAVPAALALALAFVALVAERTMQAIPAGTLPEAPALRRLLLLPVLLLPLAALLDGARAWGLPVAAWPAAMVAALLLPVLAELGVRAALRWFVPEPERATAAVDSVLLAVAFGTVATGGLSAPVRSHFGLDFSRSWALGFLRRAAMPALALTAALCWGLTGVSVLPLDRRGVYERLGEPVAVLGPGLHLGLPWPLGRVRPVELGTVHVASLGLAADAVAAAGASIPAYPGVAAPASMASDMGMTAQAPDPTDPEAPAPASADRLWDAPHPQEAEYLVASAGLGGQTFQAVSADLRVLYRVGGSDAQARAFLYGTADPDAMVTALAARLATRFFAARTLDAVLGATGGDAAARLAAALGEALARAGTGLEVVAVVVEAIHPPIGAAAAYHAVQAAEITAQTAVAAERGRAHGTASGAQEEAHRELDLSQGSAGEATAGARADAARFDADRGAAAAGGQAFLLERQFAVLGAAAARAPLTVVDHRLTGAQAPVIDLRRLVVTIPGTTPQDPD